MVVVAFGLVSMRKRRRWTVTRSVLVRSASAWCSSTPLHKRGSDSKPTPRDPAGGALPSVSRVTTPREQDLRAVALRIRCQALHPTRAQAHI
jgi:hypothetical protein